MNPYYLIPIIPMVILIVAEPSTLLWLFGFAVVYGVLLWLLDLAIGKKPIKGDDEKPK
jgi:hypothetical protein